MEKLKGNINIEVTKIDVGKCSLPEEKRSLFRTDFLATVNDIRKESANANT